ncbi:hypothetical protein AB9M62_17215 [Bacillales bacterium AN1005]
MLVMRMKEDLMQKWKTNKILIQLVYLLPAYMLNNFFPFLSESSVKVITTISIFLIYQLLDSLIYGKYIGSIELYKGPDGDLIYEEEEIKNMSISHFFGYTQRFINACFALFFVVAVISLIYKTKTISVPLMDRLIDGLDIYLAIVTFSFYLLQTSYEGAKQSKQKFINYKVEYLEKKAATTKAEVNEQKYTEILEEVLTNNELLRSQSEKINQLSETNLMLVEKIKEISKKD